MNDQAFRRKFREYAKWDMTIGGAAIREKVFIKKFGKDVDYDTFIKSHVERNLPAGCEDCGEPFDCFNRQVVIHPLTAGEFGPYLCLCRPCSTKRYKNKGAIPGNGGYTAVAYRIPEEYFVLLPGSEKVRSLWLREAITMELDGVKPYRSVASAMNRIEWSMLSRHLRKTDRRKRNDRTVVFRLKSSDVVRVKEDPILGEEELVITAIYRLLAYEQKRIAEANDTKALKVDLPYLINVDEALRIVQGKR